MFSYDSIIRLNHTDAAGVIFYARLFDLIHLVYEAMLDEIGHSLPDDIGASPVTLPIVHASADYRAPLRLNDRVRIEVSVERVGGRSYTLGYRVLEGGTLAAEARTVHVAIDSSSGQAVALPAALAQALSAHAA